MQNRETSLIVTKIFCDLIRSLHGSFWVAHSPFSFSFPVWYFLNNVFFQPELWNPSEYHVTGRCDHLTHHVTYRVTHHRLRLCATASSTRLIVLYFCVMTGMAELLNVPQYSATRGSHETKTKQSILLHVWWNQTGEFFHGSCIL